MGFAAILDRHGCAALVFVPWPPDRDFGHVGLDPFINQEGFRMIPRLSLGVVILVIVAYWAGKRFGWWPSFLPS